MTEVETTFPWAPDVKQCACTSVRRIVIEKHAENLFFIEVNGTPFTGAKSVEEAAEIVQEVLSP